MSPYLGEIQPVRGGAAVLSAGERAQTAAFIASAQAPSGQIPWFPGGHTDPWDHVEAAMGLDVAGHPDRARAAYEWLRRTQNPDGSWCRGYDGDEVSDPACESNFTAYLGVGLWHHYRTTGDVAFLHRMWPTLVAAIGFALELQQPGGQIAWARGGDGVAADDALVTGCASIYHSLRCAIAIAAVRRDPQPDWELAAASLAHALAAHPERFSPRDRYSMDWYYPVLSGALRGPDARQRLSEGWNRFVVPHLGIRCVSDRPWVTGAETCELALALCAIGDYRAARHTLAAMQHLRHRDGSYWTGYVYPDDALWPEERTTWTAGAVLLAAAALDRSPATTATFTRPPAGPSAMPDCRSEICAA